MYHTEASLNLSFLQMCSEGIEVIFNYMFLLRHMCVICLFNFPFCPLALAAEVILVNFVLLVPTIIVVIISSFISYS